MQNYHAYKPGIYYTVLCRLRGVCIYSWCLFLFSQCNFHCFCVSFIFHSVCGRLLCLYWNVTDDSILMKKITSNFDTSYQELCGGNTHLITDFRGKMIYCYLTINHEHCLLFVWTSPMLCNLLPWVLPVLVSSCEKSVHEPQWACSLPLIGLLSLMPN